MEQVTCPECGLPWGRKDEALKHCDACGGGLTSYGIMSVSSPWRLDAEGYLLTPSGTRAARVVGSSLMLYDKLCHKGIPFTFADWQRFVTQTQMEL